MASGADREPGAMQAAASPHRASSSTNVAAKAWVGFHSAMAGVITFVHGFSQHGDSWDELASLLPGGVRSLAPDVRATTVAGAEAELLGLWGREGVRRCHLVGYSQGGRIALWLACRQPERLLTLTTIGAHAGFEGEARGRRLVEDRALADQIERRGVDWFASHWAGQPLFAGLAARGPAVNARLDASRRRNDPVHLAATLRGLGAGAVEPFWDRLGAIGVPTLVVAGAEDARYAAFAERLGAAIAGARVALVAGAGHAAHLERPAAVAALLREHLAAAPAGQDG